MRLLTVFHYPVHGGPQNQGVELAAPLRAAGIETTAVVPPDGLESAGRLAAAGVSVVVLPLHRLRAIREAHANAALVATLPHEVADLRRLIRATGADVVQGNGLVNPHAALAARLEGRGVVWQLQDTRPPKWLRTVFMPLVLGLSDVVMTTGETVRDSHPGVRRLGSRAVVYYPPVDTHRFRPRPEEREAARALLGVPDRSTVVFGSLGNLNPQKGHEHALRAVAARLAAGDDVCLRILGARSAAQRAYEAEIGMLAMQLGLGDDRFSVIEPARDVSRLLPGLDAGILAAAPLSEGVPTMILEAMAAALPVVVTAVGGVREAVTDGIDGIVVAPRDERALTNAVAGLCADASLRLSLGNSARVTVRARFTTQHSGEVHARAYRLAAERAEARARRSPGSAGSVES